MVAVKQLDVTRGQGQHEFLMKISMLARYKHENLVSLVGFCDEDNEKIIVYEHEWCGEGHRVLHRDIKSSNVLLNENWEAKISDFGLSIIGPTNQEFTFLVTNACGTHGYIDPLYATTDVLTKESDVYSFCVVLFEVLCGRLAKPHYKEGKLDEIIAPNLLKQMKPYSLPTFSRIAYQCLKKDRKERPTMGLIVKELQNSLELQIINFDVDEEIIGINGTVGVTTGRHEGLKGLAFSYHGMQVHLRGFMVEVAFTYMV
ncbi:jacalin-like lectin domain-containing protein [Artemisia annua]|uniref:Jacalin-like lectin domain-containing protein n=1 Tax=Artemisia annua TaxID=35608 RepID=A0A2U1PA15_ARTAN|nr:jacalin-like lectin domain-containing protein [Artemisia annua]